MILRVVAADVRIGRFKMILPPETAAATTVAAGLVAGYASHSDATTTFATVIDRRYKEAMNLPIPILSVLIGAVILFFGRKLFWLCVAAVGFAAGVEVAPHLVHEPSAILSLSVAIVFGFIGALLAMFLQKVAIAIAGFLAGGKLALALVTAFLVHGANYPGVTFIVGGIIGAILLLSLFDWTLIVLSAVVGAYLIQQTIVLPQTGATILFVGLAVVGIVVQAAAFRGRTTA